jgi:hypothetical protein
MFFYAQIMLKKRFLVLKRGFFGKKEKRLIIRSESGIFPLLKNALSHGVATAVKNGLWGQQFSRHG